MTAVTVGRTALLDVDLLIGQGADNPFTFQWATKASVDADDSTAAPVDVSAFQARAQIRDVVGGDIWLSLTTPDFALGADGTISFTIAGGVTEDAIWNTRTYGVWDLELVADDTTLTRFAEGKVIVSHDVTRDDS